MKKKITILLVIVGSFGGFTMNCCKGSKLPDDVRKSVIQYSYEINKDYGKIIHHVFLSVEDSLHFVLGVPNHLFHVKKDDYFGSISIDNSLSVELFCPISLRECAPWKNLTLYQDRNVWQNEETGESLLPWKRFEFFNGLWIPKEYEPILERKETILFSEGDTTMTMRFPERFALYTDGGERNFIFYYLPQRYVFSDSNILLSGRWRMMDNLIILTLDIFCDVERIIQEPDYEMDVYYQDIPFPKRLVIKNDFLFDDTQYSHYLQNLFDNHLYMREFTKVRILQ